MTQIENSKEIQRGLGHLGRFPVLSIAHAYARTRARMEKSGKSGRSVLWHLEHAEPSLASEGSECSKCHRTLLPLLPLFSILARVRAYACAMDRTGNRPKWPRPR